MTNIQPFVFLLLILTGRMASADLTAKTDFYFPLRIEDYAKILTTSPLEGLEKTALPRFDFKKPFKTSIQNTVMDIEYTAKITPDLDHHGRFRFQLDITQSDLVAQKVVTDDFVEKYVGGIYVKVFLKGECTNVGFQSLSPSTIGGEFEVNSDGGDLVAEIQTLEVKGLGDWKISVGSCDGPKGYQKAVEGELRKFLKDRTMLAGLFRDQLQNKLNSVLGEMTQKVLSERKIQINEKVAMELTPQSIHLNKETGQILVRGQVLTQIASPASHNIEVPSSFSEEDEKQFTQSGFIVPQEYVRALSSVLYQGNIYKVDFLSSAVEGLKGLLGSKFFQFFLWRDLMSFKSNSVFEFKTSVAAEPVVKSLGSSNGYAWFGIQGQVLADMNAPAGHQYTPYMKFQAATQLNAWIGVLKGKALVGFHNPKIAAQKRFAPEYLEYKKRPSSSMNLAFFVGKIREMIIKKRLIFDLPKMQVDETQELVPKAFSSNEKWLQLVYEPATASTTDN